MAALRICLYLCLRRGEVCIIIKRHIATSIWPLSLQMF
ncbi:hypothetical protein PoMZ_05058 [Pyricularia oryzae]|uniref:Uncharacterized protein n=1 Tax=Pyricularia oryzae TaxID=318829 RepID=A0A4P7NAL1_PYROR|nr:hypothetical protein PoMZ_04812 [Pyricularia oryzae]QBZ60087.1 hypothetical protein PoMZ_05058 [Pyricularia oryzae]